MANEYQEHVCETCGCEAEFNGLCDDCYWDDLEPPDDYDYETDRADFLLFPDEDDFWDLNDDQDDDF